jgi:uncharacterized protein (DUF3084 family)
MFNFHKTIKMFLLNEEKENPNVFSYLQALNELLNTLKPYSLKEKHNLLVAKQHLNEIKKQVKRLHEEKQLLEEQVKTLEEQKIKKGRK